MIIIGSIQVDRLIEHSSSFSFNRINQRTQTSITGKRLTFDNSASILEGVIEIRYINKNQADQIRNFISNTIRFQRFKFDITPEAFDDLGLGVGVPILEAEFNGSTTTAGILTPFGKANKFNLKFPYRKVIVPTGANVDQEGVVS